MLILGLPEPTLRLLIFLGVLAAMMMLEAAWPRRDRSLVRRRRWPTNLAIVVIDGIVVRAMGVLAAPLLAVGAAWWAAGHGIGVFNLLDWPLWLEAALVIVALDFLLWGQHRVFHLVPLLWRMHRVHHADRDFDTTTALRFHPFEILLSMLIKVAAVLLLGPSVLAVVLFEIILNGGAMFNHANLRLPARLDAALRRVIVTPDMHRVHHSVRSAEHQRNFGFNLSLWDRLFGTYVAQPQDGHSGMRIGLSAYQDEAPASLWWSLKLPLDGRESDLRRTR